jgi:hypothetical protein
MSMPPEPVTGLCILPRLANDLEHLGPDGLPVAAVLGGQLAEARRVEIEPLDRDPDLVRADLRARVQAPRGLGQYPYRLKDAMQSNRTCPIFIGLAASIAGNYPAG